jgi:hypothetical protein
MKGGPAPFEAAGAVDNRKDILMPREYSTELADLVHYQVGNVLGSHRKLQVTEGSAVSRLIHVWIGHVYVGLTRDDWRTVVDAIDEAIHWPDHRVLVDDVSKQVVQVDR